MNVSAQEIILRRLEREIQKVPSLALGEGIPQLVVPYLSNPGQTISGNGDNRSEPVDVAVVDALEVSEKGDLVAAGNEVPTAALRWIVATTYTRPDGGPKLVRDCQLPVTFPRCVALIITEMGVVEISQVGLVLKEVAPGVATDDIKMKTGASLHIADDIKLMEL